MPVKLVIDRDKKVTSAQPSAKAEIIRLKGKVEMRMVSEGKRFTLQVRNRNEKT